MGVLTHVVGINFTLELFSTYLNTIEIVFSLVLSTHYMLFALIQLYLEITFANFFIIIFFFIS
jgi:hypothetical protein